MQEIPEKIDSKFRFVLLASKRAEQFMRGAQPKITRPGAKPTRVAMEEIFAEAVGWDYGPAEEEVAEAAPDDSAEAAAEPAKAAPES